MSSYYGPLRAGSAAGGGGGGAAVQIIDGYHQHYVVDPENASADYSLTSSGVVTGTGSSDYNWLLSGVASSYDVKADPTSGTLSAGTTGTWLNLGTSRFWTVSRTVFGEKACTMTVSIRRTSDGVVLDTASITLVAGVD